MKKEWRGSTDPEDESGWAVFRVFSNYEDTRIFLPSFRDFHTISALLDDARQLGGQEALARCRESVERLAQELR